MSVNQQTGEVLGMEECDFSGLPRATCSHCTGDVEEKAPVYGNDDDEEFEVIGKVFEAQYSGHCTIEYAHKIRRGDRVARVQRVSNPMLPVAGVACAMCVKILPKANG